jgi:RNA polymerase sigma-70 factor, ECF subfamily
MKRAGLICIIPYKVSFAFIGVWMKLFPSQEISFLLRAWYGGDQTAFDRLVPLVYDELHRLAHLFMAREHAGHTLQTTALVNEAYLRLIDANRIEWQDRGHFFAVSAGLMRRILVDFARSQGTAKRGANVKTVPLDEARTPSLSDTDVVKLDDALNSLSKFDPMKAQIVELKFFGGLDINETAEVLNVSRDKVKREWKVAKVWLLCELKAGEAQWSLNAARR